MSEYTYERLQEFAEAVKDGIQNVGQGFTEPDDDWMPVIQMLNGEDQMFMVAMPELGGPFKDAIAEKVLPMLIAATGAKQVALIVSAWKSLSVKPDEEGFQLPPSMQEDRQEIVMATISDPHRTIAVQAPIIRHKDGPPTLGEWEHWGGPDDETQVSGRFVDPIRDALRDSSGRPNPDLLNRLSGGGQ